MFLSLLLMKGREAHKLTKDIKMVKLTNVISSMTRVLVEAHEVLHIIHSIIHI